MEREQIVVRIPAQLKRDFKALCAVLGVTMEKQTEAMIKQFLEKNAGRISIKK